MFFPHLGKQKAQQPADSTTNTQKSITAQQKAKKQNSRTSKPKAKQPAHITKIITCNTKSKNKSASKAKQPNHKTQNPEP